MKMIALLVVLPPPATATRPPPPAVDAAREQAYIRRLLPNVPPIAPPLPYALDLGRVFERITSGEVTR